MANQTGYERNGVDDAGGSARKLPETIPQRTLEDAQVAADWEDIGGSVTGLSPGEVDRLAVEVYGCPS